MMKDKQINGIYTNYIYIYKLLVFPELLIRSGAKFLGVKCQL